VLEPVLEPVPEPEPVLAFVLEPVRRPAPESEQELVPGHVPDDSKENLLAYSLVPLEEHRVQCLPEWVMK